MNYFQIVKRDINDEERRRGYRRKCLVDAIALRELVNDYEKMDAFARSQSDDMHTSLAHKLSNVLRALYAENHDSERLMLLVMDILKPMIRERIKEKKIDAIFNR